MTALLMLVSYSAMSFASVGHALAHSDPGDSGGQHAAMAVERLAGDHAVDAPPGKVCALCAHGPVAHLMAGSAPATLPLLFPAPTGESSSASTLAIAVSARSSRAPPSPAL